MIRLLLACASVAALVAASQAGAATVLITGANSGLGLEFARQYAAAGWDVIATHRRANTPAALAQLRAEFDNVRIETIDVTSEADAAALARRLQGVPIDVLINNAGVYNDRSDCNAEDCPGDWRTQDFGHLRFGLFDTIFAVNVKGPLFVSEALRESVGGMIEQIAAATLEDSGRFIQYDGASVPW